MSSTLEAQPTADPAGTSPARGGWAALRPLVLRLHFYAGILVAPFLFIAAATGLLYAASWQLEQMIYSHELNAPPGRTMAPLSQQVAAARAAQPRGTVSAVRPA
ncbi:PepSY-associated TM helix domain-containing protein, partial [Nonomuraea lactucae]|uniref:PepSY-associated TM helix domain-containing protein n=1 Tax=Nonomuraea lactucae TaxID=2249762 RepID=UPI0013B46AF6